MEPLNAINLADALHEASELRGQHASATSVHIYDEDKLIASLKGVVAPEHRSGVVPFRVVGEAGRAKHRASPIDQQVGDGLRRLRQNSQLSISQMSAVLDIEQSRLIAIEAGFTRVPAALLMSVCAFFGVPVSMLYQGLKH